MWKVSVTSNYATFHHLEKCLEDKSNCSDILEKTRARHALHYSPRKKKTMRRERRQSSIIQIFNEDPSETKIVVNDDEGNITEILWLWTVEEGFLISICNENNFLILSVTIITRRSSGMAQYRDAMNQIPNDASTNGPMDFETNSSCYIVDSEQQIPQNVCVQQENNACLTPGK